MQGWLASEASKHEIRKLNLAVGTLENHRWKSENSDKPREFRCPMRPRDTPSRGEYLTTMLSLRATDCCDQSHSPGVNLTDVFTE